MKEFKNIFLKGSELLPFTFCTTQNFQGWNTLTASNDSILSGGTSDFTARSEIHITGEFHAAAGSEVHIYCAPTFSDCSPDFYGFRLSNPYTNNSSSTNKEIEVDFRKASTINSLSVIPNPSTGLFLVQLNSKDANAFIQNISIFDLEGRIVYANAVNSISVNIDLSNLSKGLYFIKANDQSNSFNQKIILN